MKKFVTLISSLLLLALALHAQQTTKLVGMGTLGGGSVFAINEDGTNPEQWVDFDSISGYFPGTKLTISNGRLWGLTNKGGSNGYGTIFSLGLNGSSFNQVYNFDSLTGRNPYGSLVESDGKLWGMTSRGGSNDEGTLFCLGLDGNNFTKIHDFDSAMGRIPKGSLIEANNKLWGMTSSGGATNVGVIFSLDKDGTNYNKVHDFDFINGADPRADLVESDGKLWGMTLFGGSIGHGLYTLGGGVIFTINLQGNNFTKVHEFTPGIGLIPNGNLVEASGKLWGMTLFGPTVERIRDLEDIRDGVIFSIDLDGSGYTEIHEFDKANGSYPSGSLVESNGKLWGITMDGGANNMGVVFNIDLNNTNFSKVYDFGTGTIGGNPRGSLLALTITGLDDSKQLVKDEITLQLYPNPVDNSFKLSEMGFMTQQVEIYNLNGRLVKQFEKDQVEYDVSNLTPGIYMIVIESPHTISYQKMVKK